MYFDENTVSYGNTPPVTRLGHIEASKIVNKILKRNSNTKPMKNFKEHLLVLDEYIDMGELNRNWLQSNQIKVQPTKNDIIDQTGSSRRWRQLSKLQKTKMPTQSNEKGTFVYNPLDQNSYYQGIRQLYSPNKYMQVKQNIRDIAKKTEDINPFSKTIFNLRQAYIPSNLSQSNEGLTKDEIKSKNIKINKALSNNPEYKRTISRLNSIEIPKFTANALASNAAMYHPAADAIGINKAVADLEKKGEINLDPVLNHEGSHKHNFELIRKAYGRDAADDYSMRYAMFNQQTPITNSNYFKNNEEYFANKTALGHNVSDDIRMAFIDKMLGKPTKINIPYIDENKGRKAHMQMLKATGDYKKINQAGAEMRGKVNEKYDNELKQWENRGGMSKTAHFKQALQQERDRNPGIRINPYKFYRKYKLQQNNPQQEEQPQEIKIMNPLKRLYLLKSITGGTPKEINPEDLPKDLKIK